MFNNIKSLFNPERYHGWSKSKSYFEGWYYKIINAKEDNAYAIIPGVAMDKTGNKHAFIQTLDGKKLASEYYKFDFKDFHADTNDFRVKIKDNLFSIDKIIIKLPNMIGELKFLDIVPWTNTWYSPGIMGPYSFVPFMECNHNILSIDHTIQGKVSINNQLVDFSDGKGYIEKDWGKSFPSAYIWMQSNHFKNNNISVKLSIAKIPWIGSSFVGFICGLWINGNLIQFTTYNKTQLKRLLIDKTEVHVEMVNKNYQIKIDMRRSDSTALASPISGFMNGRINESMTAEIDVVLIDNHNNILLNDTGRNAGLEIAGNVEELITD
jgi:hypothetical protein